MVELEELKTKWEEHSRRLEESLRLNRELLSAGMLKAAESGLHREAIYAGGEVALWLLIVFALGNFIAGHFRTPELALSAAAADAMCIGITIALIRGIVGAVRMDYSGPIAAIQKQVEALRLLRIRTTQWSVLCGTLLWLPSLAVVWQAAFGVNIYRRVDAPWLIAHVLFGLALLVASIWVSKKYGDRMDRSPIIQRLMKDLAGKNLNAVQGHLAVLAEFERG